MRTGDMSLKEFSDIKNNILFISDWGGLGDVLIHRLIFEDAKKLCPDFKIHFCLLGQYLDAIKDNTFIDEIVLPENLNKEKYLVFYQTCVKTANKYESHYGIECKLNRAEVWALFCGFELNNPKMHFSLDKKKIENYKSKLNAIKDKKNGPIVVFNPTSAITTKCLQKNQIKAVIEELNDCNVFVIEKKENLMLRGFDLNQIINTSIEDFIYYTACSDYVITVDTATFHLAGGLGIPMTGIFTFANGKTYGKFYDFILVQKHKDDGNWNCGPCYNYRKCPKTEKELKPCLTELSESEIKIGIRRMFEKWPRKQN
jgi:ADP-heptose:LPS heptosyltransferase